MYKSANNNNRVITILDTSDHHQTEMCSAVPLFSYLGRPPAYDAIDTSIPPKNT